MPRLAPYHHAMLGGLAPAAPFAAFALFSAVMAARHAASLFPLGQALCGHPPLAHCAWCLAAPAAAAMALIVFAVAAARPAAVLARPD